MMKTRARRTHWLSYLSLAALLACDSDGTGPGGQLQLTPGQAAPFALVEVQGLPGAYASVQKLEISVGGARAMLVHDAEGGSHRFMVPDLVPGTAEVVIPGIQGEDELRAELRVTARQYAGGSAEAALEEMNVLLDSMQVSLSFGLAVVDADADSATYGRVEAFLALAEGLQEHMATLSPQDRATVAGLFSVAAPELRILSAHIAMGIAELRAQPPILGARAAAATAPLSASVLVSRCVDYEQTLKRLDRLADIMGYVATAANGLSWFAGPAVRAAVGIMTAALTVSMDLAVIIANSVPNLLDPQGLRLQVSPTPLRHDGGTGAMTVWVRRRASGEVLGSALGAALDLGGVVSAIRKFESARKLVDWQALGAAVGSVVQDLGIEWALGYLDEQSRNLLADFILPSGEVQATFEGVVLTGGHPHARWEFTGPAGSASRAMRTIGQNQQTVESFTVAARIGSSGRCTASTSGGSPESGINGFQIAATTRVRFLPQAHGTGVEVNAGASGTVTLPLTNEGTQTSGALTYRLQHAGGQAYSPPSWLVVSALTGPSRLGSRVSGSVTVTVRAASDALQQEVVIPVAVMEDGKVVDHTSVQVRVLPQLSDIVVNRTPSTLRLWDHGQQDGDIITVTLNGAPVASGITLTNAGVSLPVEYRLGRNVLIVRAHNEGSLVPNTAALGFANVVRGPATQTYGLSTGETTQLVITYDPNATPSAPSAAQRLPEPVYTRCAEGARGDCRP